MGIETGRKLYSLKESYIINYKGFLSLMDFVYVKKNKILSEQFIERIMIAVTEVNGCEICSYAHTKMALEAGMSNEEIQKMFAGTSDDVPPNEMPAILFAQHYADFRGYPSKDSWERIVEIYGLQKSKGILGVVRVMMWGNVYGISFSSFVNRFKGKPDKRSNLLYELGIIISLIFVLLIASIHAFLAKKIFKTSIIKF